MERLPNSQYKVNLDGSGRVCLQRLIPYGVIIDDDMSPGNARLLVSLDQGVVQAPEVLHQKACLTNPTQGGLQQAPLHPPTHASVSPMAPASGIPWIPVPEEFPSSALEGLVELEYTCLQSLETSSQRPLTEAQVKVPIHEPESDVVVPRRGMY